MSAERLLGVTEANRMTIDLDRLGAPGVPGCLIVEAQFSDDRYQGKDRINDHAARPFLVKGRLSKVPQDGHDMRGDIQPVDGASFLLIPAGKHAVEVAFEGGTFTLLANERGELSSVSTPLNATSSDHARSQFLGLLAQYLDRVSYLYSVPIHVDLLTVHDRANEVQYIYFIAPPRPATIAVGGETLSNEMKAVYALYREAMNSSSSFYRVLCLYKIMEGLLGPLSTSLYQRARKAKVDISTPKAVVPDHVDMPKGLRDHVGKPIKQFFDRFLSKQYRDAVAHFELKEKAALNLSSPRDLGRFTDVAFVADLTARILIARHDEALRKFEVATAQPANVF